MRLLYVLAITLAIVRPVGTACAQSAVFQGLGVLSGGTGSEATDVSADGAVVVGSTYMPSEAYRSFRWTAADGMVALGAATNHAAYGVSADGAVVVGTRNPFTTRAAYRWTADGSMVDLGDLPGGGTFYSAYGVSADGAVVVGSANSAAGLEATRWTVADGPVALGDLPGGAVTSSAHAASADGSVIVGTGTGANGFEAFRWTAAGGLVSLGDLPGGLVAGIAYSVSADGAVVVGLGNTAGGEEAVRWMAAGGLQSLGYPAGYTSSRAASVSADGAVTVGSAVNAASVQHAVVWTAGGVRLLQDVLTTDYGLDLTGWTLTAALAVSADGQTFVGYGVSPTRTREAFVACLACGPTATEPGANPTAGLALSNTRPSPAHGTAALTLTLDQAQAVTVAVFDPLGRRVAVLYEGLLAPGPHRLMLDAGALAPGVYVIRATGAEGAVTRRVVVGE